MKLKRRTIGWKLLTFILLKTNEYNINTENTWKLKTLISTLIRLSENKLKIYTPFSAASLPLNSSTLGFWMSTCLFPAVTWTLGWLDFDLDRLFVLAPIFHLAFFSDEWSQWDWFVCLCLVWSDKEEWERWSVQVVKLGVMMRGGLSGSSWGGGDGVGLTEVKLGRDSLVTGCFSYLLGGLG